MGPEAPARWSWQPPTGLTLRTDTRKMQGSSRPVAGLALILHTKVNLFRHRTQFSCTSSLRAQGVGAHVQGGEGPAPCGDGRGALTFHFVSQSDCIFVTRICLWKCDENNNKNKIKREKTTRQARVRAGWAVGGGEGEAVCFQHCLPPSPHLVLGPQTAPLAATSPLLLDCRWLSRVSLTKVFPGWTASPFHR